MTRIMNSAPDLPFLLRTAQHAKMEATGFRYDDKRALNIVKTDRGSVEAALGPDSEAYLKTITRAEGGGED